MARYVRLYDCPSLEKTGTIVGFSSSLANTAYDPELHAWFRGQDYTVTEESEEQKNNHITLPKMPLALARATLLHMGITDVDPKYYAVDHVFPTEEYFDAPGIPLPENTISRSHLLLEPPLRQADEQALGVCLSSLESVNDRGLRRHFLMDSRGQQGSIISTSQENVIFAWG